MNQQSDFSKVVREFSGKENSDPTHRYRSFDFCYLHFHPTNKERNNIQQGCFVLWGYLASWGMLRGSSFLLDKNPAYLKPLVEFIIKEENEFYWKIDVENYPDNYKEILQLYENVKNLIIEGNQQDKTLVTKILLGVFAIVPAYDNYFGETFRTLSKKCSEVDKNHKYCGFTTVNQRSLEVIHEFYLAHKKEILEIQNNSSLMNFEGIENKDISYTSAKVIDMYGFTKTLLQPKK